MRETFSDWARRTGIDVRNLNDQQISKLVAAFRKDLAAIKAKEDDAPTSFRAVPKPAAFAMPVQLSLAVPKPEKGKG
jgi:hypothetical protein